MSQTSKYFIKLIKEHIDPDNMFDDFSICIKNLMIDSAGHKFWDLEDNPPADSKKVSIVGVSVFDAFYHYFNCNNTSRSYTFEHNWTSCGEYAIHSSSVKLDGNISKFLENVFMQMMLVVDRGNDIYCENEVFIKKNTAYEHLAKIDLLDIE